MPAERDASGNLVEHRFNSTISPKLQALPGPYQAWGNTVWREFALPYGRASLGWCYWFRELVLYPVLRECHSAALAARQYTPPPAHKLLEDMQQLEADPSLPRDANGNLDKPPPIEENREHDIGHNGRSIRLFRALEFLTGQQALWALRLREHCQGDYALQGRAWCAHFRPLVNHELVECGQNHEYQPSSPDSILEATNAWKAARPDADAPSSHSDVSKRWRSGPMWKDLKTLTMPRHAEWARVLKHEYQREFADQTPHWCAHFVKIIRNEVVKCKRDDSYVPMTHHKLDERMAHWQAQPPGATEKLVLDRWTRTKLCSNLRSLRDQDKHTEWAEDVEADFNYDYGIQDQEWRKHLCDIVNPEIVNCLQNRNYHPMSISAIRTKMDDYERGAPGPSIPPAEQHFNSLSRRAAVHYRLDRARWLADHSQLGYWPGAGAEY